MNTLSSLLMFIAKNKVGKDDIHGKDDFVLLEGTISQVASGGTGVKTYSKSELASLGISDITQWLPISIGQSRNQYASEGTMVYASPFGNVNSGMTTYKYAFPYVELDPSSSNEALKILVYNESESYSKNVKYSVLMMKVR